MKDSVERAPVALISQARGIKIIGLIGLNCSRLDLRESEARPRALRYTAVSLVCRAPRVHTLDIAGGMMFCPMVSRAIIRILLRPRLC